MSKIDITLGPTEVVALRDQVEHTPGPWKPVRDAQGICGLMHPSRTGIAVAWFSSTHNPLNGYVGEDARNLGRPEREANARLCLAASDLLFVLKQIIQDLPLKRDWLDPNIERLAKEAIAKALGK